MRYRKYLALLWVCGLSYSAFAIVMPELPTRHLQIGLESLRIQNPDMDREGRRNYFVSYHDILHGPIGAEVWLMFAPDMMAESDIVDIRQDFYSLYATLSYHYVKLFRYSVLAGPGMIYERISYDVLSSHSVENVYVPSLLLKFSIDYAVTTQWEVGLQMGFQQRSTQNKLDWSYGVGLNWNF